MKKILSILAIAGLILAVGLVGNLDHDEYLEAEQEPVRNLQIMTIKGN